MNHFFKIKTKADAIANKLKQMLAVKITKIKY